MVKASTRCEYCLCTRISHHNIHHRSALVTHMQTKAWSLPPSLVGKYKNEKKGQNRECESSKLGAYAVGEEKVV